MKKERYNSIDCWKFILTILVVSVHTGLFMYCTNHVVYKLYYSFERYIVPFFFLTSGFLLGSKMQYPFYTKDSLDRLKKFTEKMIYLYLVWSAVYLPLAIYDYCCEKVSWKRGLWLYIKGLLFQGEHYNSWILWYLLSAIYATIGLYVLLKLRAKEHVVILLASMIMVISIFFDYIINTGEQLPVCLLVLKKLVSMSIRNGRILRGLFYVPVGIYLSNKRINKYLGLVVFLCGYIINLGIRDNFVILGDMISVLADIGLFVFIIQIPLKDHIIYKYLRKMSTTTYFIHMYVWSIYCLLLYGDMVFGVKSFFYTLIISYIISIIYIFVERMWKRYKATKIVS